MTTEQNKSPPAPWSRDRATEEGLDLRTLTPLQFARLPFRMAT